jgi:hypothetical protein
MRQESEWGAEKSSEAGDCLVSRLGPESGGFPTSAETNHAYG